ncbi:MAG TPA: alpha/beta fold hydrolase [Bryobacteraceae bacterium]|jgi:pimeloyl-ACP methyl ester carboxylesterase|nr:alpha/beta fold hydrolase [Bryobacteraceae bacterium]
MAYIVNEGAKLYWHEQGSGPPVLLIMGLSFTHEMWFRLTPALVGEYRTIVFDNRGMGRSDVPRGPYTMRRMASDARAVLDAAGVEAAHVVGASMGGMIAQELALRHPRRVRSLLLGCTSSSGLFGKWPEFRYGPREWRGRSREERERSLRKLLYAQKTPAARIEEDLRVRCSCTWCYKGFVNQFAGVLMWSAYGRLPRIQAPTLVVHGDEDRLVPPENGRVVASRIPGARFELIRDAGHILTTDQPEACAEAIRGFLREEQRG